MKQQQIGFLLSLLLATAAAAQESDRSLLEGFVYADDLVPNIFVELRYFASHNFIGRPIDGYEEPRLILSVPAARALGRVQEELGYFGLGLKVFDGYRPQRAVDHFVRWAEDPADTLQKSEFYPQIEKRHLFRDGYIASRSGHTRGSTVDLTIVSLPEEIELDMGGPYDFFGPLSWPEHSTITPQQRANRLLLKTVMIDYGFRPYAKEWWHFTLQDEPFPDRYFDFPVR